MKPRIAFCFTAAFVMISTAAIAEGWPSLERYARDCVLVVRVRQVGEYSKAEHAKLELQVIDTWVGKFDPKDFTETHDDHILAYYGEHGMKLEQGQEAIVFYTRHNQPPDKLSNHSTSFPIADDKVMYALTADEREGRHVYSTAEFRKRILDARK